LAENCGKRADFRGRGVDFRTLKSLQLAINRTSQTRIPPGMAGKDPLLL
jgi:hypothetical protein